MEFIKKLQRRVNRIIKVNAMNRADILRSRDELDNISVEIITQRKVKANERAVPIHDFTAVRQDLPFFK